MATRIDNRKILRVNRNSPCLHSETINPRVLFSADDKNACKELECDPYIVGRDFSINFSINFENFNHIYPNMKCPDGQEASASDRLTRFWVGIPPEVELIL